MDKKTKAIEAVVLVQWQDDKVAEDVAKLLSEGETPRWKSEPGALAAELKARADYLRSRPMADNAGLQRAEREVLAELGTIEVRARALEVERRAGKFGPTYLGELAEVQRLAFAVRARYAGLLETLDERYPTRTVQADPKRRAEELDAIEKFLAAKRAIGPTGTEGA